MPTWNSSPPVIDPVSPTYFESDLAAPTRRPLDGDREVDAVVIGAGFAGLSAARTFVEDGLSVLLVERGVVGCRASGRNGGILLPGEGAHLGGSDGVDVIDAAAAAAAGELVQLMETHSIDAGLTRGTMRLALTQRQARGLRGLAAQPGREYLDRTELRSFVASERYLGGLYEPDGVALDPRKLAEGLAQAIESSGGEIVEHTTALELRQTGARTVVVTDRGSVTADRLVVAAGTELAGLVPQARRRLATIHSQIAVTEPAPALIDACLPQAVGCCEVITYARYFRKVGNGRLMFGISSVLDPIPDDQLADAIGRQLRQTFPELGGVGLEYAWSGQIASTPQETAWMQHLGPTSVLTCSNGVLASWASGRIAATATTTDYALFGRLSGYRHGSWPPLGIPMPLVRLGGRVLLTLKDKVL